MHTYYEMLKTTRYHLVEALFVLEKVWYQLMMKSRNVDSCVYRSAEIQLVSSYLQHQDWIVQCLTSPPTQYRLYGRRFLQVKRPNQQYQSTEGESCKGKQPQNRKKTQITHMYAHTK